MRSIVSACSVVAFLAVIPTAGVAQRIAPLPPPCAVRGSDAPLNLPRQERASLSIAPLTMRAGGDELAFLSRGLPTTIARRISAAVPRIVVSTGRGPAVETEDAVTGKKTSAKVEVDTRYVLTGTVTNSEGATRVSLSLYDAVVRKRSWAGTFRYDSSGVLPIVIEASNVVASQIAGSLTADETERLRRLPTRNRRAYEWMVRGDAAMDASAYDRAADAYRRAVGIDRTFNDAYAKLALADAALVDDGIEKSTGGAILLRELRSAATRAVTNDPASAFAWLAEARARVLEGRSTSEWRTAFDRALKLDSRDPQTLQQYGLALAQADDRAAARTLLRRAAALLPPRAEIATALAELAVLDKNEGEACGLLNYAIATDALYGPAWSTRALLRVRHGDLRLAWADAETATQVGNALLGEAAAAIVDLKARDTSRARTRLGDLWLDVQSRVTISVREGRSVALAFLAAGQVSRALDVLEAVRPRGPLYAATLRDPGFDRARREPRFRALVAPPARPPEARVPAERTSPTDDPTPARARAYVVREVP